MCLTRRFFPDRSHRLVREVQTLVSAGHPVLVVSDNDSYPVEEQRFPPADLRGISIIRFDIGLPKAAHEAELANSSPLAGIRSFLSYTRTVILAPARLLRVANWWRADVIHVQGLQFSIGALIAAKLMRVPMLLEFRQPFPIALGLALRHRRRGFLGKLVVASIVNFFTLVEILMCFCASSVICISDEEKDRLVRHGVPNRKIAVIGHSPRVGELLVRRIPIRRPPHPTIIYAGWLDLTEKGVDLLLEAFSYFHQELPDARLIIVGDGPARSGLEMQARELSIAAKVDFLGWLDAADVFDVIRAADVAVIPHRISTMPSKLFAYMHCGKPIVASDFPGIRGIILGSQCGELFRPGDAEDLARALRLVMSDEVLRSTMAANARMAAKNRYNWENESQKLLDIYSKLGGHN